MDKLVINQVPIENLRGKRVFVRIDADFEETSTELPIELPIDEHKLRVSLPTLEHLTTLGARVVIGTHRGDPGGTPVDRLRVDAVAERLSSLISKPVRKLNEAIGTNVLAAVTEMRDGEIVLLENLRFYPGEDANDGEFARDLAELCDVYCDDAVSLAHRGKASTVAITRHVRPSAAGLALARELIMFEPVLDRREPPFVGLIAGARIEEKLPVIENLLGKLNRLFIGGALAFLFMKARGQEIGAAQADEALLPLAEGLLDKAKKNVEIILPEDFRVVHTNLFKVFEASGRRIPVPHSWEVLDQELTSKDLPVDIGSRTLERIRQLIDGARTFFWNGPLGISEVEPFAAGTREVARALIERARPNQRSVVCGNSLARAIRSFDLSFEKMRHLSTGGESALQMLAGKPLPAVAALDDEADLIAPAEKHPHRILLPVDGSEPSLEAARKIGGLVDAEGAEIMLLYVQKPPAVTPEYIFMDVATKRRHEMERRLEAERVMAPANAALLRQGLVAHRQMVIEGDPEAEILKIADEMGVDLIAMGAHGRTGVLGFFLGSVSRKVLDQARCPVLIVRVPGQGMAEAETEW
jgi:phosphoglycerate kinase